MLFYMGWGSALQRKLDANRGMRVSPNSGMNSELFVRSLISLETLAIVVILRGMSLCLSGHSIEDN